MPSLDIQLEGLKQLKKNFFIMKRIKLPRDCERYYWLFFKILHFYSDLPRAEEE